jgi:hypothetical protein
LIEPTFKPGEGRAASGPTRAQARKTACLVAAVLLLFAAWQFYRGRLTAASVVGGLGVLLLLVGLFVPALARGFHKGWMRAAAALGYVNSRVLLSLIYYGVFTPYRLGSRLAGRDPLRRRGRRQECYWVERERTRQPKEQFERLF